MVIVLIGRLMGSATGVAKDIAMAKELDVPVDGVYVDGATTSSTLGQPMDASGFRTLASYFPDRTVITYDPRGLGRSTRTDGRVDNVPTVQADDVHAVIGALGVGPVEMANRCATARRAGGKGLRAPHRDGLAGC